MGRKRAADYTGLLPPNKYPRGQLNGLVDVPGVRVGHVTLQGGSGDAIVNTGVTAVLPHGDNVFQKKVEAGFYCANGFGKAVGAWQVTELGELETPLVLTATLSAWKAADALVSYVLDTQGNESAISVNPAVAECNDGALSDIRARPITAEHIYEALGTASDENIDEGCVGCGTGLITMGFKGGVGTASRQSNFFGTTRIGSRLVPSPENAAASQVPRGSCNVVVATDAPLSASQLTRLAKRGCFALGLCGANYANGSGDFGWAFSTTQRDSGQTVRLSHDDLDPLFEATMEAVEEAVFNAMVAARDTLGPRGAFVPRLPFEDILHR